MKDTILKWLRTKKEFKIAELRIELNKGDDIRALRLAKDISNIDLAVKVVEDTEF